MNLLPRGLARRLALPLLLACGLGGCAVYGPPYSTYAPYAPYVPYETSSPYVSPSPYYAYSQPAYVYPPLSLDLGFTWVDRGPRHHGRHGWGHHHRRGHHGWGHHHGRGHHGWGHHRGGGHGGRHHGGHHHGGGHGRH